MGGGDLRPQWTILERRCRPLSPRFQPTLYLEQSLQLVWRWSLIQLEPNRAQQIRYEYSITREMKWKTSWFILWVVHAKSKWEVQRNLPDTKRLNTRNACIEERLRLKKRNIELLQTKRRVILLWTMFARTLFIKVILFSIMLFSIRSITF